jgi:hypothetical protein
MLAHLRAALKLASAGGAQRGKGGSRKTDGPQIRFHRRAALEA